MSAKTEITLSPEVVLVLRAADVAGKHLKLPGQLDRKLYLKVAAAIEALGGKWVRKAQAHVFEHDPTDAIEDAIATGAVVDLQKVYQFYETPPDIARQLVEIAGVRRGMSVLEPSAGKGAIVAELVRAGVTPHCCELWDVNRAVLRERFAITCIADDFFELKGQLYNRIVANPPFSGQQDIKHVQHMFELLVPGGILVTIMSPRWRFGTDRVSQNFRTLQVSAGTWTELPEGSFKVSGTNVRAGILKLRKRNWTAAGNVI